MSAFVSYAYYTGTYMGTEVDQTSFPALCARAEDVIGAMTHWSVTPESFQSLPSHIQTLFQKAICAQIDYFGINGTEIMADSGNGGFTVGKVSIHAKATSVRTGSLNGAVSPMAVAYLEQTGLMNPQVETRERWW